MCLLIISVKIFILYSHSFQEPLAPVKAPNLLLVGSGGDAVSLVCVYCSELIKVSASGGGGEMVKFGGTCYEKRARTAMVLRLTGDDLWIDCPL